MVAIAGFDAQIADQRRLAEVANSEYAEVSGVALKGLISKRDMEAREAAIISRHLRLAEPRFQSVPSVGSVASFRSGCRGRAWRLGFGTAARP